MAADRPHTADHTYHESTPAHTPARGGQHADSHEITSHTLRTAQTPPLPVGALTRYASATYSCGDMISGASWPAVRRRICMT